MVIMTGLAALIIAMGQGGPPLELTGPDGSVVFRLETDAEGRLTYSVSSHGRPRLLAAPLGIIVDGADLGTGARPGKPHARSINETFPWRGNKTTAANRCAAYEIPVESRQGNWILEVRVFDDGAAFRYRVPGASARRVNGEATAWRLPGDAALWFQTDTTNYEGVYRSARADQVPAEETVKGKARKVHLGPPVTAVYPDGTLGMISEARLFNYSGMTLRSDGAGLFLAAFQDDPGGWDHTGEILSPWRVAVLARDLDALVNSDVIPALCDPPDPALFPEGINTDWIKAGKAPCTWMVYGNDGAQWDRQKWFVDVAAATGCEYLLVDAGWRSERWGWLKGGGDLWARAAELCRYAAERNVGIVLWHAYPEGRNDSPGLTKVEAREELFRKCREAGVRGVKIDFFDNESKAVVEACEDLLRRAAKYRLMVNFHGVHKPTGEARTWPNEITREGIREQEYVLWGSLPLAHYGALPFTRMAAGHADFLPGYVQKRFLKNTTSIFQMACVVVFSSPFLCWPDNPEAYLNSPLLQFVRTVPVTWDETRVLPGSAIGDTVIMARRKGDEWYLAALNCRAEPRELSLDVAGLNLGGKILTLYQDGPEPPAIRIDSGLAPPADGKIQAALRPGGGFILHGRPPRKFAGWK